MDPFSKPEELNTFRADSTIVSIRCSFEGRCIFVTVAMLKEVCALVFECMDRRQYATEMNLAQLSTDGCRIQLKLINTFVCCFETKYPDSFKGPFRSIGLK
jgi:hypothetical protein